VRALLDALDAHGVKKAVVTSTPRVNLDFILDDLGIAGRFDALVSAEDTARGKPDPQGFLLAAARVGVEPARCTVIEDAPHGLEAGVAAGARAIGVTTSHPAAELTAADLVVDTLDDPRVLAFALAPARS
jgi:HAD superfamily hydrolase (TIGR01509 family)